MKISNLVISILVFVLFSLSLFTFLNSNLVLNVEDRELRTILNKTEKFTNSINEKLQATQQGSGFLLDLNFFSFIFFSVVDTLKFSLIEIPNILLLIINYIAMNLGIPSFVVAILITILVV